MDIVATHQADPDEFGVCDGRDLARPFIARAYSLLVPYVLGCPACANTLFSAVADETISALHAEAQEQGGLPSAMVTIHEPGPHRSIFAAAHVAASKHETLRLLRKADAALSRQKCDHRNRSPK